MNNNKKGVQPFVACAFRLPPSDLHNTSIEQSTPMSVNFILLALIVRILAVFKGENKS